MNNWIKELEEIGLSIFGRESAGEMWAMVVICVVVAFLLYRKLSSGFVGHGEKAFLTLVPGVMILVSVTAAVRIYLNGSLLIQLIAVLIFFLGLVLPLTAKIEKTGYLNVILPWGVTAIVLAAILYIEPIVMDAISTGIEKGSLIQNDNAWDR